jgi:AhpC/TSA family
MLLALNPPVSSHVEILDSLIVFIYRKVIQRDGLFACCINFSAACLFSIKTSLMKTLLLSFSLFMVAQLSAQSSETLSIGASAPAADVKMMDISGAQFSLSELKKPGGLLVIFSCNGCPFVVGSEGSEGWEGRYDELRILSESNNIGMALINSNEAKRDKGDDMKSMKTRAEEHGFAKCKYLLDVNSQVANAFYARTTPHVYLFDTNMKLVYKGAIDDNVDDHNKVKEPYLKEAIKNLAAGKKIKPEETKPVGCSIKRVG